MRHLLEEEIRQEFGRACRTEAALGGPLHPGEVGHSNLSGYLATPGERVGDLHRDDARNPRRMLVAVRKHGWFDRPRFYGRDCVDHPLFRVIDVVLVGRVPMSSHSQPAP